MLTLSYSHTCTGCRDCRNRKIRFWRGEGGGGEESVFVCAPPLALSLSLFYSAYARRVTRHVAVGRRETHAGRPPTVRNSDAAPCFPPPPLPLSLSLALTIGCVMMRFTRGGMVACVRVGGGV